MHNVAYLFQTLPCIWRKLYLTAVSWNTEPAATQLGNMPGVCVYFWLYGGAHILLSAVAYFWELLIRMMVVSEVFAHIEQGDKGSEGSQGSETSVPRTVY